jgi:hypothetical protein
MFGFFRPRKKLESLFGTDVPPEVLDELIKTGMTGVNQFKRKNIHFLCVAVDGTSEEEIGGRIGAVLSIARESGWFVRHAFQATIHASGK